MLVGRDNWAKAKWVDGTGLSAKAEDSAVKSGFWI